MLLISIIAAVLAILCSIKIVSLLSRKETIGQSLATVTIALYVIAVLGLFYWDIDHQNTKMARLPFFKRHTVEATTADAVCIKFSIIVGYQFPTQADKSEFFSVLENSRGFLEAYRLGAATTIGKLTIEECYLDPLLLDNITKAAQQNIKQRMDQSNKNFYKVVLIAVIYPPELEEKLKEKYPYHRSALLKFAGNIKAFRNGAAITGYYEATASASKNKKITESMKEEVQEIADSIAREAVSNHLARHLAR